MAGNELGSVQIFGGHFESDDYKNGDGKKMHTNYNRKNASIIATLTPPTLRLSSLAPTSAGARLRMRTG